MRSSASIRLFCAALLPSITPSIVMIPARYISPSTSMIPDPQMPVTPVFSTAASNPSSSDQRSTPITRNFGSSVSLSMRIRSIAPGAARCPDEICAPSKAGPVGDDAANKRSLLPTTISALVPTSTIKVISSAFCGASASTTAAASAPTWPAIQGRI